MKIIEQDILSIEKGIICHQINCCGVMGAGLALNIKNKWPKVYKEFLSKKFQLGDAQFVNVDDNLWVANLAGQDHFGHNGRFTNNIAFGKALTKAVDLSLLLELPLYIPYNIGCGYGGGDWKEISCIIDNIAPNALVCKI